MKNLYPIPNFSGGNASLDLVEGPSPLEIQQEIEALEQALSLQENDSTTETA